MEEHGMDPEERKHILMTMIGSFLILVGYYLPWYSLVFEPPGGYAWLNGLKYYAFTYGFSGLNVSQTTTTELLLPLIWTTLLLCLFDVISLVLPSSSAKGVISVIDSIVKSKGIRYFKDILQALAHVLVALAWIAFVIIYLSFLRGIIPGMFASNIGGSADAIGASHYVSVHFGIGLILMFVGLLVTVIALFRKVAVMASIVGVLLIFLACTHSPYLGLLLHRLGY